MIFGAGEEIEPAIFPIGRDALPIKLHRLCLAGWPGIEPDFPAPGAVVLPLDDRPAV